MNGPCVGYGLTAAAACDFLIASDRAMATLFFIRSVRGPRGPALAEPVNRLHQRLNALGWRPRQRDPTTDGGRDPLRAHLVQHRRIL